MTDSSIPDIPAFADELSPLEIGKTLQELTATPPRLAEIERVLGAGTTLQELTTTPSRLSEALRSIFHQPPEPDYRRSLLETLRREANHKRAYEDAVIKLAQQQTRPDTAQGEPAPLSQSKPDKPEPGAAINKPRLSDKEILGLRQKGFTNERIHKEFGVSKDRITRVNKSKGVTPLAPGPKPKVSD